MRLFKTLIKELGAAAFATAFLFPLNVSAAFAEYKDGFSTASSKQQGYGKDDINEFCTSDRVRAPESGVHFDGTEADPTVLAMTPGRYSYPNEGAMLFYPDGQFLLRLPDDGRDTTYGTDGSDLLGGGGIVGGCFAEQLSEVIANNSLDVELFTLVNAY